MFLILTFLEALAAIWVFLSVLEFCLDRLNWVLRNRIKVRTKLFEEAVEISKYSIDTLTAEEKANLIKYLADLVDFTTLPSLPKMFFSFHITKFEKFYKKGDSK